MLLNSDLVLDMAREVLPVVRHTPVLAGVCGTDPFRVMPRFLREVRDAGFSGVQNFPTVGLIDGLFRANLEETGMGYGPEIDLIRAAHELDLLTTPYVFDTEQARDSASTSAPGTAAPCRQRRRISRKLARCQLSSGSPSASASAKNSSIFGSVRCWCASRRKVASCSARAVAPPDGIIAAVSQWSIEIACSMVPIWRNRVSTCR